MVPGARDETPVAHRGTGALRWCHIAGDPVNAILVGRGPSSCESRDPVCGIGPDAQDVSPWRTAPCRPCVWPPPPPRLRLVRRIVHGIDHQLLAPERARPPPGRVATRRRRSIDGPAQVSPLRRRSLAAVIALASLLLGAPDPAAVVAADPPPGAVAIRSDLVVYGGTPGGIVASISAARAGAKVTLLEPTSRIGGMMTNGLSVTDVGDPSTVGGISREVFTRIQALEGTSSRDFRVEPHIAEQVFTDLLRLAGVRVRTGERLVRPGG